MRWIKTVGTGLAQVASPLRGACAANVFRKLTLAMVSLVPVAAFSASVTYEYDELGRLTHVRYGADDYISYEYDKNGSLTRRLVESSQAPANVTAVNASDGQFADKVKLTWNAVPGATVYRVFRCATDQVKSCGVPIGYPKDNLFDDRKGVVGTVYHYRVKACSPEQCSGFSAANTGYSGTDMLPMPTGVNASDGAYLDRVRLTWNTVAGATVYRLFRCTTHLATSCGSPIGFPQGTTFDDRKGLSGKVYSYRVKACVPGKCSPFSMAQTGYRGSLSLAKPTGIEASDGVYPDRVKIKWTSVLGATVYRVFRCTTFAVGSCGSPVGFPKRALFDDRKAPVGKGFVYRVRACTPTKCGWFSNADSGYSGVLSLAPPKGVTASDGKYESRVQVAWNAFPGAESYRVFRCGTNLPGSCGALVGLTKTSPFDDTGGVPGTVYYYRVKSCVPGRCSGFSMANTGHSGAKAAMKTEAVGNSVQDAVPIPIRSGISRWLLISMTLGIGLLLLRHGYARKPDKSADSQTEYNAANPHGKGAP